MGESLKAIFAMDEAGLRSALSRHMGLSVADLRTESHKLDDAARRLGIDDQYAYGDWCRVLAGCTGPLGGHFVPNGFGCHALATMSGFQKARALLLTMFFDPRGCRYKTSKPGQRAWIESAPPKGGSSRSHYAASKFAAASRRP